MTDQYKLPLKIVGAGDEGLRILDAENFHVFDMEDDMQALEFVTSINERDKLQSQLVEKDKRIKALEAKIDALMLEHCPEEMTTGQFDKWRDCHATSTLCARAILGDKDATHELIKRAEEWKAEGLIEFED